MLLRRVAGVPVDGGGGLMDKPIPNWLQYSLIFSAVACLAAAIDLYVISLTPFITAALAVWAVKRLEDK